MADIPRVSEVVTNLKHQDNEEVMYLVAGALNLYIEAMRRRAGRIIFNTNDVRTVLGITLRLIEPDDIAPASVPEPSRSRTPTPEEAQHIMAPPSIEAPSEPANA